MTPSGPLLSRRGVLRAGLVLPLLVACTDESDPAPEPDPDVALTDAAVLRERELLAAYDAALVAAPALAERLAVLRADHEQHLVALAETRPAPSPSATASASPPAPAPPPLPADPAGVLAALAGLERTAGTAHGDAAVLASRRLAPVLASLAASEAAHPVALA